MLTHRLISIYWYSSERSEIWIHTIFTFRFFLAFSVNFHTQSHLHNWQNNKQVRGTADSSIHFDLAAIFCVHNGQKQATAEYIPKSYSSSIFPFSINLHSKLQVHKQRNNEQVIVWIYSGFDFYSVWNFYFPIVVTNKR